MNKQKIQKTQTKMIVAMTGAIILASSMITGCTAGTPTTGASSSASSAASTISEMVTPTVTPLPSYEERTQVRIATLKGPTGMGAVKLFADNEAKTTLNRYVTTIVNAPEEIVSKISTGEIDIAAVPTNLASTLYNKTGGKVQLLALNTLGVLSILDKGNTVTNISDLKGKTLYASGQGSTPEFILNYILKQNGIDPKKDITIVYKTEHSELATLALSGKADLVMLPEPFVTTVLSKNAGFRIAFDLTKEWKTAVGKAGITNSVLSMGGLIVRKEFAEKNKEAVNNFLKEYEASIQYVNTSVSESSKLVAKYGIMASADLAAKAIPNCNITYIDGDDMKTQILNLYQVFFAADPKSIGGALPGEDFYYHK